MDGIEQIFKGGDQERMGPVTAESRRLQDEGEPKENRQRTLTLPRGGSRQSLPSKRFHKRTQESEHSNTSERKAKQIRETSNKNVCAKILAT